MKGLGQSGLQAGYAMQDLAQGGIGGVINNIAGLTQALGGGPGLAGVLTLAGVGFLIFKDDIMAAAKSMGLFKDEVDKSKTSVEQLETRIKELTEKPIKLAVDMNELNQAQKKLDQLKKDQAAFDELGKLKSEDQAEAGKRVTKALAETGEADVIQAALRAKAASGMLESDPILKKLGKEIESARKGIAPEGVELTAIERTASNLAQRRLDQAQEAARKRRQAIVGTGGEAEKAVGQMLERAESGKEDETVDMLGTMLREIGRPGVAEKLTRAKPGAVEAERLTAAGEPGAEAARKEGETIAETERKKTEKLSEGMTKSIETFAEKQAGVVESSAERMRKTLEKRVGPLAREVSKGSVDEEAALAAAKLRAQGGYEDPRTGRFVKLDEAGQQKVLQEDIRKRLPDLGGATGPVASQLAREATAKVNQQVSDAMAGGLDMAAANQSAIVQNMEALLTRMQSVETKFTRVSNALSRMTPRSRTRQFTTDR
jgi:hypothetical protein